MRVTRTTFAEMETTVRWSREDTAELCTADPMEAKRWTRRGYPVQVLGRYADDTPRTWQATIPKRAITLRRLPLTPRQGSKTPRQFVRRPQPARLGADDSSGEGSGKGS